MMRIEEIIETQLRERPAWETPKGQLFLSKEEAMRAAIRELDAEYKFQRWANLFVLGCLVGAICLVAFGG